MSGSASIELERSLLQHSLAIAPMPVLGRVYVALCQTAPTETAGGIEASGGGYSRMPATFALMSSPSNAASNVASVEFLPAAGNWGTIGYFELWTAATGGTRLYWGQLTDPADGVPIEMDVTTGDVVRFSAGALIVQAAETPMTGSGVSSFNTRTGVVTLTSADVTMALTYTPYNSTNPSGYQTAADVAAAIVPTQNNAGRNTLHNGAFAIAQRGVGPFTANGYTVDRWTATAAGGDTFSFIQGALGDGGRAQIGDEAAAFFLGNTFTGTAAAAANIRIGQGIENVRRLAGKTVTLSFWAVASAGTPKLGINAVQNFGTGGSPSAAVQVLATGNAVTLSTNWARYSTTIAMPSVAGKTLGTNADSFSLLQLFYSSGATSNAVSGNIGAQSGTINIWGVQLEVGAVATPFEHVGVQIDHANCQRFYFVGQVVGGGYQVAAGSIYVTAPMPVSMRAAPVVTLGSNYSANIGAITWGTLAGNAAVSATAAATATGTAIISATFTASADL